MDSVFIEILKRVDRLAAEIAALKIVEGSGTAGGAISGSGTTNRITQWTGTSSLGDSTLIKTGVGVLTISSDTDGTLTIPTTGTAALGAGTLSVSSISDATIAAHTHPITSSSNPGAAASLLASNASGYLQLVRLGAGGAPTNATIESTASGAGAEALRINIDRAWTFRQLGTGASTSLELYSLTAGKFFVVNPNTGTAALGVGNFTGKAVDEMIHAYASGQVKILCETSLNSGYAFFRLKNDSASPADFGFYGTTNAGNIFGVARAGTFAMYASTTVFLGSLSAHALNFGTNNVIRGTFGSGGGLTITGGTDTPQLVVKNNATQTTNPVEVQSSAAAQLAYITPTGGAVFNENGDAAGDVRMESDTEVNMFWLDANGNTDGTLYLGGSTNGIQITKGGELTLIGTATRWNDLRVEPVVRNTGSKAPSFINWLSGLYLYDFDDVAAGSEKEIFFQVQMPHDWKEQSTISPHVHWTNKTGSTAGQVVRWGLEYTVATIGGTFGTSTTIYGTTIVGGGDITVANEHMLTELTDITMTGNLISTVLVCRLFRNSSNAADTYTGTAGLLYVDFHYEIDTIGGSKDEFTK